MFAVYDGHGKNGHACARFAKNKLPRLVAKHLRAERVKKYKDYVKGHDIKGAKLFDPKNWPYLSADEYKAVCRKAFLECNEVMHDTKSVSYCLFCLLVCFGMMMMIMMKRDRLD